MVRDHGVVSNCKEKYILPKSHYKENLMWIAFFLALIIPGPAYSQLSSMNCERLDPRSKISKETETRINASVKTVLKVAQAGGEIQKKAKEEIQNIPATATSRDQIEARWIYLFCEMLRTSGNLSEAQKKQYFDALITATKPTAQPQPPPKAKQSKEPTSELKKPNIVVVGALPLHLWEKIPGPDKTTYTDHRLSFLVKIQNNTSSSARVNVAVLEGCVPVQLSIARAMLVDGETLPEPLILDKTYGELQKTTIQRVRVSGTIRPDSRDIPALGIAYIGVLFPLPLGRSGASLVVPETVSTKGKCDVIKKWTSQPSVQQLLKIGPINYTFPNDIAPGLRDGRLKLRLHIGSDVMEINPQTLGQKLFSVASKHWQTLLLPEMYEIPDEDYPPTRDF